MGLDPGSRCTGFVILDVLRPMPFRASDFRILDAGALQPSRHLSHADRLGLIHNEVFKLAERWLPCISVIEQAFIGINYASALRLGESRGSLIAALRRLAIPVAEISPTAVKKAVAGSGQATKLMVYEALKAQMKFDLGKLPLDVSDAIAIGVGYGLNNIHPARNP